MKFRWAILLLLVPMAAAQIPCMGTVSTTTNIGLGLITQNPSFIGVAGYGPSAYDQIINQDWSCIDSFLFHQIAIITPCSNTSLIGPVTPNFHFNIPAHGTSNWDALLNQNASCFDTVINPFLSGAVPCFTSGTRTPNVGLALPASGTRNWYTTINANFTCIDRYLKQMNGGGGPPNYLSPTQQTDPGSITSLFNSTSYTGTVNTNNTGVGGCGAPAGQSCVTQASGSNFPVSCANLSLTVNNVTYPIATCNSISSIYVTGSTGTQTGVNYAHCEGDCQNTTHFDTTIPGYVANTNCITRLTDVSTVRGGQSIANLTCSGGANNNAISSLGDYLGPVSSGGAFSIQNVKIQNGCLQVINTGVPALKINCTAGFAQAPANDQCAFYMSGTVLHQTCWDSPAANFTSDNVLVDFLNCPNVSSLGTVNINSEMADSLTDDIFGQAFGQIGTQGTATILSFYQVSTNKCRSVNLYTGNYYDWCTPGAGCSSEAALGTLSATGNSCWGIPIWTGTGTINGTGDTLTWASGHKFGFTTKQTLSMQAGGSACNPSGGVKCVYGFTVTDNQHLSISPAATSTQLSCGSLPCTVTFTVINGVHGMQCSGDGNFCWISFGANGGFGILDSANNPGNPPSLNTSTACAGSNDNTQVTYVPVFNTVLPYATTQWGNNENSGTCSAGSCTGTSGQQWAGHPSMGQTHTVSNFFAGPTIRTNSNLTAWNIFSFANNTLYFDAHGAWPHFCNNKTTGDDSCPWLQVSDQPAVNVGAGTCNTGGVGNPVYCPKYGNLVLFSFYPNTIYPPGKLPNIFAHNFICGNLAGAQCLDGPATQFGEINAINSVDPQGRFMIWVTSMLHGLGNDSSGAKESDAFGIVLY